MKLYRKAVFFIWIFLTYISYPVFVLSARNRAKRLGSQKRVLVIPQLTRIGDIVCSTGVFYNIKKHYPDSYLAVLVSKKALGIIKNNPRIDEFILLEDYSNWQKLIMKLRNTNFNYSVSLSATSVSTCWALWSLIANRIKTVVETPPISEILTDWLANKKLLYKNHTYLPAHHIRLLEFLGIENPEDKKEVFLSNQAEIKAENWRRNIPADHKIVGLSISAGNKIKELGDEKFVVIIKKLLALKNIFVVVIGSKGDAPRIEQLIKKINNPNCIMSTDFNLEELPSLMKRFSLYIAVDTGPIYIAHALGVPLIDIIGPVDPNEQPPEDERSIRVLPRNNVKPTSFVFKRRGPVSETKRALESTDPDDIVNAAIKLLG